MAANPIIYLTGAPATGKSTIAQALEKAAGARIFSYGAALAQHPGLDGVSHDELRSKSSAVVTRELIAELDRRLPDLVAEWRRESPVVIDSHAVTSEPWGLRAIPYSPDSLVRLGITHIVCLIADADTLRRRIENEPAGRRKEDVWKLDQVNNAQMSLAISYAHSLGSAVHLVDARPHADEVCAAVAARCGFA